MWLCLRSSCLDDHSACTGFQATHIGIPPAGLFGDADFSAVPGSTDCIMIEDRREIPPGFKVSGDHHSGGQAAFAYSGGRASALSCGPGPY